MIGQKKLLNRIQKYTYSTFPSSVIIEGEFGCGKKTIVRIISEQLNNLSMIDISDKVSNDTILDAYINTIPQLYIIDINKASQNKKLVALQNSILKFIEEPPANARIIILCENKNQLLPTIQNRCQIFSFEKYTISELRIIAQNNGIDIEDELFSLYNTPGKILSLLNTEFTYIKLTELVNNIIDNISKASIPNLLTIVKQIDFGNGGYNLDIFLSQMRKTLVGRLQIADNCDVIYRYYRITAEFASQLQLLNINKEILFENYLLRLKGVTE